MFYKPLRFQSIAYEVYQPFFFLANSNSNGVLITHLLPFSLNIVTIYVNVNLCYPLRQTFVDIF